MKTLVSMLLNKCPNCKKGFIFKTKGNSLRLKFARMHKTCTCCGCAFEKEPGYFFGAMYVSYGLGILEMGLFFLVAFYMVHLSLLSIFIGFIVLGFLCSNINFKWSRTIWIYMFNKSVTEDKPAKHV